MPESDTNENEPNPPILRGFRSWRATENHFGCHASRLTDLAGKSIYTSREYERSAKDFAWGIGLDSCRQCKNRDGETVRFDTSTEEFAVISCDGFIKTYFIPDPYEHRAASNRAYFERQCVTRIEQCNQQ